MELKINSSYPTATGFIIPRSHYTQQGNGAKWAVIEVLTTDGIHYQKRTTTMSAKEIKSALGLAKNERAEIV